MNTIELCKKVGEVGWPGQEDPEHFDATGYAKAEHERTGRSNQGGYGWQILDGKWAPNPGRIAMINEIEKLIGRERFVTEVLGGNGDSDVHQAYSHEDLMAMYIRYKQEKHD